MTHDGLGLPDGAVALSAHNDRWGLLFREEAEQLRAVFGTLVKGIEHVGSTAIPGIRAKPILDILAGLPNLQGQAELTALATIGYEFRPGAGLPAELVFVKGHPRTHILHVVEWEGLAWRQKLAFRNALRESPPLAREYDALKLTLSQEFAGDRAAYTAGKTDFVGRVVAARDPHSPFLTRD